MVKKENRKYRMWVDFKDLNKACPKEYFPILNIDRMVKASTDHQVLILMDTFSWYNQIFIHLRYQE